MKPLLTETQDTDALRELGRASVQIVHDIKNQLNGLKLYATFLRKRMEKNEAPADELETINKLIAGLERAASDMTALVRLGRPMELRRQPRVSLSKVLAEIKTIHGDDARIRFEPNEDALEGEFDATAITEALKMITTSALNLRAPASNNEETTLQVRVVKNENNHAPTALIEWRGIKQNGREEDPFHSFAGSDQLRMSLAAKIIEAHGGQAAQSGDTLRVHLPLKT